MNTFINKIQWVWLTRSDWGRLGVGVGVGVGVGGKGRGRGGWYQMEFEMKQKVPALGAL